MDAARAWRHCGSRLLVIVWLLGLQGDSAHTSPQPMSAVEALQEFDWGSVRADTADRSISQDDFDAYSGL